MAALASIFKRNSTEREAAPLSSGPFQSIHSPVLNQQPRQQSPATFLPVQIELSHFRPIAFRIFTKKHNLTLKSDALAVLAEYIGRKCGSEWRILGEPLLDEIARAWARAEDSNPLVDGDLLVPILKTLEVPHIARSTSFVLQSSQPNPSLYESQSGDLTPRTYPPSIVDPMQFFSVIDAFTQPKYTYNPTTKQFQLAPKPTIISAPKEKAALFRQRYDIILQRLLQNELFQTYPTHAPAPHQTAGQISSIKNLLGRRGQHFLLFGLLVKNPAGILTLSDPDASIVLDVSDAVSAGGIFTPGIFVLVDGKYTEKNSFRVHTMVLPPSERREASKRIFGHVDFLGARDANLKGGLVPVEKEYERFLVKAEKAAGSVRMVFAGELNLDRPCILRALKAMFEYYAAQDEAEIPLTFILIGSFISTPFLTNGYSTTYKEHWDALADILSHYPRLTSACTFVFIPGPNDPWTTMPGCLPRKGIPEFFTNRLRKLCKHIRFASNPVRLGYFTQEICVFRHDIADSLIRNRIVMKSQASGDPTLDEATLAARELVKTVLDQSHLTPFPLHISPTYWSFDHTMRIYPLPTVLIICDTSGWGPFKVIYEGCYVINTGSMLRVDQGDGRGRYTATCWEWDCGMREGKEVVMEITDREERGVEREKKKKRVVEKSVRSENAHVGGNSEPTEEISQIEDIQGDSQMEKVMAEEMPVDV